MRKLRLVVVLLACLLVVVGVAVNGASFTLDLVAGDTATINCSGTDLQVTDSGVTASADCIGPTPTPLPYYEPYLGAPECTDHNSTEWHSLWNYTLGCHYTHEHNDDPHSVDDIFGPVGELYGGQSISYPWQTFAGGGEGWPPAPEPGLGLLENEAKHGAYGWLVRRDIPTCTAATAPCIHDARVAFHALMSYQDAVVRFHSGFIEARALNTDGTYGIIKLGGWYDYSCLKVDNIYVPLPGVDPAGGCNAQGKRGHNSQFKTVFWYGLQRFMGDEVVPLSKIAVATADAWGPVSPSDPYLPQFFCDDYQCPENNSTMSLNTLEVWTNDDLDTNGDGRLDGDYWTDRYGLDPAGFCTAPGLDCVPLHFENWPIANLDYLDEENGLAKSGAIEYDLSPEGVFWIEYEN